MGDGTADMRPTSAVERDLAMLEAELMMRPSSPLGYVFDNSGGRLGGRHGGEAAVAGGGGDNPKNVARTLVASRG